MLLNTKYKWNLVKHWERRTPLINERRDGGIRKSRRSCGISEKLKSMGYHQR